MGQMGQLEVRSKVAHKRLKWTMGFRVEAITKGPNGPGGHPEMMGIQNRAAKLDHAKREIVAARFFEIPAESVMGAARDQRECS